MFTLGGNQLDHAKACKHKYTNTVACVTSVSWPAIMKTIDYEALNAVTVICFFIIQYGSSLLQDSQWHFAHSRGACRQENNAQVWKCLFATLQSVNMCNFTLCEVKPSLNRRVALYFNERHRCSMVQLNLSSVKATPWAHVIHNSFILPPFAFYCTFSSTGRTLYHCI